MKKKILVICYGIGGASGLVFERLLNELSKYYKLELIVSSTNPNQRLEECIEVTEIKYLWFPNFLKNTLRKHLLIEDADFVQINGLILKYIVKFLGFNPLNQIWANRILKYIKSTAYCYDHILGLMDYNGFASLIATCCVSESLNVPAAVYSTDANPAPNHWDKDMLFLNKARNLLNKYYPKLSLLMFSNDTMVEYEKSLFEFTDRTTLKTLYTNSSKGKRNYTKKPSPLFLYTGSAWGPRKLDSLFEAFKMLLKDKPDAQLVFIGTREYGFNDDELKIFSLKEREQILSIPRTKDKEMLDNYYETACCYLDINAKAEFDPFLSSKITNYILYNRPIIAIAGTISPVRTIFNDMESVYLCKHDAIEIYKAMKDVVKRRNDYDFTERTMIINEFSVYNVCNKLRNYLEVYNK